MTLPKSLSILLPALLLALAARASLPEPFRDDGLLYPEDIFPALAPLLRIAANRSPEIEILQQRVAEREGDRVVAESLRRFRVDANARLTAAYEMRGDIPDRFRGGVFGNVSAARPLYHWGRLENQSAIGQLAVEAAEHQFERGSREHLNTVRFHYLQWVLQQQRLERAARFTTLLEQLLAAEERQLAAGRSTETAVIDLRARLAEHVEGTAFVEREAILQRQALQRLLGTRDLPEGSAEPAVAFEPTTLDGLERLRRRFALLPADGSPGIRLEETLREIEDRRYQIADRNLRPRLDFVAGIHTDQLDAFDSSDFALRMQYFAGVQVSWNLFDGRRTRGEKMSILARRRIHDLQIEGHRFRLDADTERLFADLELTVKQIAARQTRADIARSRLDVITRQVADNLATETQRIEAELELAERELRVGESRIQYLLAMAHLASLHFPDPAAR